MSGRALEAKNPRAPARGMSKYSPENLIPMFRKAASLRNEMKDSGFTDNGGGIHSAERILDILGLCLNKGEPRMNTNGHEDRWSCLASMRSREEAPWERGRPARTTLAQPHPSLPPGSTGNGATFPLQPSPGRSCRQGGRAPHHGERERPPNPEDAGETPALSEGRLLPSVPLLTRRLAAHAKAHWRAFTASRWRRHETGS